MYFTVLNCLCTCDTDVYIITERSEGLTNYENTLAAIKLRSINKEGILHPVDAPTGSPG